MADVLQQLRTALAHRYKIELEIGSGGMAMVFLAEDRKHRRPVAIKIFRPESASVVGAGRFLREIEIAARLNHPHILSLYDSGEADGIPYYVMPYVDGGSLGDRLRREKQLPVEDALQIAQEIAQALHFAHGNEVVHRDIKPENILLAGGHAIVADFGIAQAICAGCRDSGSSPEVLMGTPAYMSPEQVSGEAADPRGDVYSLACVLYEMLTGQAPYAGQNVMTTLAHHAFLPVPSVRELRPDTPKIVDAAIKKALAKEPARRYETAAEFAETLARAMPRETVAETGLPQVDGREARRAKSWRPSIAAALGVVFLTSIGGLLVQARPVGNESLGAVPSPGIPGTIQPLLVEQVDDTLNPADLEARDPTPDSPYC